MTGIFSPKKFSNSVKIEISENFWSQNFPSCNVLSQNFVSRKIHGFSFLGTPKSTRDIEDGDSVAIRHVSKSQIKCQNLSSFTQLLFSLHDLIGCYRGIGTRPKNSKHFRVLAANISKYLAVHRRCIAFESIVYGQKCMIARRLCNLAYCM